MNESKIARLLVLVKQHPKKSLFLVFLLSMYSAYKQRKHILNFTFNQVITRMNQKLMKTMSEQVSHVDKYNKKLAELQQFTEEFYQSKKFKEFQSKIFGLNQIEELRFALKNLRKDDSNYPQQRTDLFKRLTDKLYLLAASVQHFSRQFELLLYLAQLIFVRERGLLFNLMDQDHDVVQQILIKVQTNFCQDLLVKFEEKLLKKQLPSYQNTVTFDDFKFLILSFSFEYEIAEAQTIIDQIDLKQHRSQAKYIIKQSFADLYEKVSQQDLDIRQGLQRAEQHTILLVDELLFINSSPSAKAFYIYQMQFNFRKLAHRFDILAEKQVQQDAAIFTFLTALFQICKEEYISDAAEQNNELYYQKKTKQAFAQVNVGQTPAPPPQMRLMLAAINESNQNKILNQTIRQFSRKVYFQDDSQFNDDAELKEPGLGKELASLFQNFTTEN